jgi:hypothetical protein
MTQIGLAAQSGSRFDADRTAGPQTNDADRGQAFGSSQIEPGRKLTTEIGRLLQRVFGRRAPGPLAKQTTPLVSYWSNGGG